MDNKSNKQWVWLALDAVTCEKQLEFVLAQEMKHLHKVCGTPYHLFTAKSLGRKLPPKELRANVRSLILTFGRGLWGSSTDQQISCGRKTEQ